MSAEDERVRPTRLRVGRMQDVELDDLVRIERATVAMYHALGMDGAAVSARTLGEIGALPQSHSVWVAEADYVAAGYLAWRDEAPGVGYIEELSVDPALHRFGIGTKLFEKAREEAAEAKMAALVLKMFTEATWAAGFYAKLGFEPLDGASSAPTKALEWLGRKLEGQPWLRPGELVLFLPLD